MPSYISNLGYWAMVKETTKGVVPSTPNVFIPAYSANLNTNMNLDLDNPMVGNKFKVFQALPGLRTHGGDASLLAEPNTAARIMDMILNKTSTSGAGPYTHNFAPNVTNPNSYTVDIAKGPVVFRFAGVEASELSTDYDENKMLFNLTVGALKSFIARGIASVASTVLTLDNNYDTNPADLLVSGDLVRIFKADGTTVDTTISSINTGADTVTVASATGVATGDVLCLRPQTNPTLNTAFPFLKARSEGRFAADAATALSATQTRVKELTWTLTHDFTDDNGEQYSGSFDPLEFSRGQAGLEIDLAHNFKDGFDLNRFLSNTKRGLVVRHFSETGYELRVTFNNLRFDEDPVSADSGEVHNSDLHGIASYDTTDGSAFSFAVINNVATI